MANLRQIDPKEVTVGGMQFYIRPFPAFKAANMTGELASVLAPIVSAVLPLVDKDGEEGSGDLMDMDLKDPAVLAGVGHAFDGISGDKIEKLLRQLLTSGRNIAFKDYDGEAQVLTEDYANEIFCGEIQNMYILAFEVIRINFNGFFKKAGSRFGISGGNSKQTERAIL